MRAHNDLLKVSAANDTRPDDEPIDMVQRIAGAMVQRLPAHVERAELVSVGNLALVESAQRYDPSRGVPFGAYAAMRVRGAMLDSLRQVDAVSREERARLRHSDAAPSVSLVDASHADDCVSDEGEAEEQLLQREQKQLLWRALSQLPERERRIVHRYFFDGASLKEIGAELNVSESRICQLVTRATGRLRDFVMEEKAA